MNYIPNKTKSFKEKSFTPKSLTQNKIPKAIKYENLLSMNKDK
jgi:hypothetical protein